MARAALSPIPRSTLAHETRERLRKAILSGELAPGSTLPEAATAARLGVSRVPVREALVDLERRGLVQFDPSGRARVRRFDEADLREILTLRASLQTLAARLAAMKLEDGDLDRLRAIVDRADRTPDLAEFSALDTAFHDEIVVLARHRLLSRAWAELRDQMELWLSRLHRKREARKHDVRQATFEAHGEFIEVLARKNPDQAARLMEKHCISWNDETPDLRGDE